MRRLFALCALSAFLGGCVPVGTSYWQTTVWSASTICRPMPYIWCDRIGLGCYTRYQMACLVNGQWYWQGGNHGSPVYTLPPP